MDFLAAMRIFVRVVERGSMSAAARDLGLGQPAVSERIERLEAHLGARLLRRNTRALSVTEPGAAFYERCKTVLDAADEALSAVNKDVEGRGTLRLAAPHAFGETVLPPLLLKLRARHPGLKINLVLNDRIIDPITEGVDISFRLGDHSEEHFICRKLGHVHRVLVASPAYLSRNNIPLAPGDLIQHCFARVTGLFNNGYLPLVPAGQKAIRASIEPVITVSHWRALHAILLQGGAIGVLQEPGCREDLAAGRLVQIFSGHTVPGYDLSALYSPARPVPQRIRLAMHVFETELPRALANH